MRWIVLDSSPLGALTQRLGVPQADACRKWLGVKTSQGIQIIVPEVIDYEVRRELIRARKTTSVRRLDYFLEDKNVTLLPITSEAMRLAAILWAQARQRGRPTADVRALDVDVILAAQVLNQNYPHDEFVVATSNVAHISQFVPADLWTNI